MPVCPHAGGVGLCEYVIHLRRVFSSKNRCGDADAAWRPSGSLIDYIAVSGTMERNVLEYVDHLHEHFLYPCSINQKGRYDVPSNPVEGYRWISALVLCENLLTVCPICSIEMHKSSIAEYEWPNGSYWAKTKEDS